jgi:hypothetical protein
LEVLRGSQADISNNAIDSNGQSGVVLSTNSVVNLGSTTGSTIFDLPNTTTVKNGNKGIFCSLGGVAAGRRGGGQRKTRSGLPGTTRTSTPMSGTTQ